jgi:hypothetical protein
MTTARYVELCAIHDGAEMPCAICAKLIPLILAEAAIACVRACVGKLGDSVKGRRHRDGAAQRYERQQGYTYKQLAAASGLTVTRCFQIIASGRTAAQILDGSYHLGPGGRRAGGSPWRARKHGGSHATSEAETGTCSTGEKATLAQRAEVA